MCTRGEHHGKTVGGRAMRGLLIVALAVLACRTGGPNAQGRTDGEAFSDGPGPESVLSRGSNMPDAAAAQMDTAPALTGAGGSGGAPTDAGPPLPEAGPPPTATGCAPPEESAVCDPVCDTGCPALSRCNVTGEPRTGRCIGIWISGEGDLCLKTDVTDPCAAHLTCVEGACRRLCYRDADCASPGTCCGQDLLLEGQPSGYKLCVSCPS